MAVAHVQTLKTVDNDGNTTVTTSAMTFSAAGLALLGIVTAQAAATPTISTVKLDGATVFSVDKSSTNTAGGFTVLVAIASLPNISAGSHTVTVTFTGNQAASTVFLTEVSGAATSSAADGTGAANFGGPSTAADTGAITTTNADDFWYCVVGDFSGSNPATATVGAGWTIPTNGTELNGSANQVAAVEYKANPGSTSGNGQFTVENTEWVIAAMPYKVFTGGGGGGTDSGIKRRTVIRPAPFRPMGDAFRPGKFGGWR